MSASMFLGTLTAPFFDTRYALSKFQPGSPEPVASLMCFQSSGAVSPFTLPSFMRIPPFEEGKFFEAAKAWISASVSNSCPPYSCEGKAKMASFSAPCLAARDSKRAYPFRVKPHWEATLVA
eukprot:CAMPEP_0197174678 /NCGR_PEP_ID=MMETSP1423-20130617/1086_1 /TAXON_ID=476441 /ORGANISM="Pseudo-nitzschia heimii, Strain UNC1101" /LENGTH=121 /DNA_ID=CAMNT_0042623621 /DNA_START=259 /DNA_END=624 /DNA_ORIENTATION=+